MVEVVVVHMTLLSARNSAALGVNAKGPVTTTFLRAVALTGHAALGLIQLLNDVEAVPAVALAAVLRPGYREALGRAIIDTSGVADLANVWKDFAADDAIGLVLVAADILEALDVGGLASLLGRLGRGSRLLVHGCGRPDGDGVVDSRGLGARRRGRGLGLSGRLRFSNGRTDRGINRGRCRPGDGNEGSGGRRGRRGSGGAGR